jgi:Uma2 family endonuclease
VCDVSPSTERLDRARKMPAYAREKVAHLWLVNPIARTLEDYRRTDDQWLLLGTYEGGAHVQAEPFEVVVLDLGSLWGEGG